MPTKLQSRCTYPSCQAWAVSGARCAQHARQRHAAYDRGRRVNDPALAEAARFRSSGRWKRFRAGFVARNPLCCDPFNDHGGWPVPTAHVHHVIGLAVRLDLGLSEANCRPLCVACHNRVEGLERKGTASAGLFCGKPGVFQDPAAMRYTDRLAFADTPAEMPPATLGGPLFASRPDRTRPQIH